MSISRVRVSTATDYQYTAAVSNSNTPRLKNQDGSDYTKATVAFVHLHIDGTGTADTDQFYRLGYNGSGNSEVRAVQTNSPNVSNRPQLFLDASGYPSLRTGHNNNYSVRVHVIKSLG